MWTNVSPVLSASACKRNCRRRAIRARSASASSSNQRSRVSKYLSIEAGWFNKSSVPSCLFAGPNWSLEQWEYVTRNHCLDSHRKFDHSGDVRLGSTGGGEGKPPNTRKVIIVRLSARRLARSFVGWTTNSTQDSKAVVSTLVWIDGPSQYRRDHWIGEILRAMNATSANRSPPHQGLRYQPLQW